MLKPSTLTALAASLSLFLIPHAVLADGLYPRSSSVLQIDGKSYRDLIEKSNHTSIVEFYAPWCGHCKNLAPAYEKAAKSLAGLAKVAAVNCDDETNKPFCGAMGVQGFPTLKIVRPGKQKGKPTVEDYQGAREAKAIVDAVRDKIPNLVKRLKDSDYQAWLEEGGEAPKAILFSDKGTVSALLRAVAIDFKDVISVAQIRDKEKQAVGVFNVDKFPTLVLLPGDGKPPVHYDGDMKKDAIVKFLSQAASPNPDPAPRGKKSKSSPSSSKADKSKASKASKASSSFSKASASHASSESAASPPPEPSQTEEVLEDSSNPQPNPPEPSSTNEPVEGLLQPIPPLYDGLALQRACLNNAAGTCVLVLLPNRADATPDTEAAIYALSEISSKHAHAKRKLFPFYQLSSANSQAGAMRSKLEGMDANPAIGIVAVNGKRGWYRTYTAPTFSLRDLEDWVDALRMGDLPKSTIPEGLVMDAADLPPEAPAEPEVPVGGEKQGMEDALKNAMPEGVQFELEEVDEEEYERLMANPDAKAKDEAGESVGKQEDPTIIKTASGGPNETPIEKFIRDEL